MSGECVKTAAVMALLEQEAARFPDGRTKDHPVSGPLKQACEDADVQVVPVTKRDLAWNQKDVSPQNPDMLEMIIAMKLIFCGLVFGPVQGPLEVQCARTDTLRNANPVKQPRDAKYYAVVCGGVLIGYFKIVRPPTSSKWCFDIDGVKDGPQDKTYVSDVYCRVKGLGKIVTLLAMAVALDTSTKYVQLLVVRLMEEEVLREADKREVSQTRLVPHPDYDKLKTLYGMFGFKPMPAFHPKEAGQEFFSVHASVLCKNLAKMIANVFTLEPWQTAKLAAQKDADAGTSMSLKGKSFDALQDLVPKNIELNPTRGCADGWKIFVIKRFKHEETGKLEWYKGIARWDPEQGYYHVTYPYDNDGEHLDAKNLLSIVSTKEAPVYIGF